MSVSPRTLAVLIFSLALTPASYALEDTWHVAIGTGLSFLNPDTGGSGLNLEDDTSNATGIIFGIDVNPLISAEFGLTNLGSASLSANQSIEYQAISVGAVAYITGEKEAHFRQNGLSSYLRLGFSAIENESLIPLRQSNNTAFWLGAGVQWPFNNRWSVRGEFSSFDGDANTIMASIVWRNARSKAPIITSNTTENDNGPDIPVANAENVDEVIEPLPEQGAVQLEQPVQQSQTTDIPSPSPIEEIQSEIQSNAESAEIEAQTTVIPTAEIDAESSIDSSDDIEVASEVFGETDSTAASEVADSTELGQAAAEQAGSEQTERNCFSSPMRAEISQSACSVLNGVLAGLDFKPDTSQITLLGRATLDRVSSALKRYPMAVVELQAHTQEYAEAGLADRLSRERVVNVARYLATQGIPVRQLRARSFGSTRPRADNATAAGRRSNNRVEIKLL
jgi:outer membrane protein OmpA-like peptidoglycan-associated protein